MTFPPQPPVASSSGGGRVRPCMTIEEDANWHEANRLVGRGAVSPCVDCTTAFHLDQREAGRCDSAPNRRPIEVSPDSAVARVRAQWRVTARRYRAKQRAGSQLEAPSLTITA